MRTHYLDFKTNDGEKKRVKCTQEFFDGAMNFWITNPSYPQKLDYVIDARDQVQMVFSMADFTGQGGKIKSGQLVVPELPEPKLTPNQIKKRNETIERIGVEQFGKNWRQNAKKKRLSEEEIRKLSIEENISEDKKRGLEGKGFTRINN